MGRFDFFKYLDERRRSIPPSEVDIENFDPYMTQMGISMAKGMDGVLDRINTESFFKLTKRQQCLAFTALDGYDFRGAWQKTKKKSVSKTKDEFRDRIVKVFDCTENDANSYIEDGLLDKKVINELYLRAFEPENVKIRKKRKK